MVFMKSKFNQLLLVHLTILAVLISCTTSKNKEEQAEKASASEITDTIMHKMKLYAEAINLQDSAALINSYVAGTEFKLYSDGKIFSYDEMKQVASGLRDGFSSVYVVWDTIVVTLPSNTVALATAPFHRRMVDKAGKIIQDRGVANWLFVYRNGQWKMIYGHGDHHPE